MFGHEVAALAAVVGELRGICKYRLKGEDRDEALALIDQAEAILTSPNGDSEQREKWREQKRAQKARRAASAEAAEFRERSAEVSAERVEKGVEVEAGVEAEEEVATPTPARPSHAADVAAVYAHWRTHHPKAAPRLLPESLEYRRTVLALKAGHSVSGLCKSIDGYHRSPFHSGANDSGQKNQGLDLILRDEAHITKGIEMADDPLLDAGFSAKERRGMSATQAWLDSPVGKDSPQ